jgi:hypothetical protein
LSFSEYMTLARDVSEKKVDEVLKETEFSDVLFLSLFMRVRVRVVVLSPCHARGRVGY